MASSEGGGGSGGGSGSGGTDADVAAVDEDSLDGPSVTGGPAVDEGRMEGAGEGEDVVEVEGESGSPGRRLAHDSSFIFFRDASMY